MLGIPSIYTYYKFGAFGWEENLDSLLQWSLTILLKELCRFSFWKKVVYRSIPNTLVHRIRGRLVIIILYHDQDEKKLIQHVVPNDNVVMTAYAKDFASLYIYKCTLQQHVIQPPHTDSAVGSVDAVEQSRLRCVNVL